MPLLDDMKNLRMWGGIQRVGGIQFLQDGMDLGITFVVNEASVSMYVWVAFVALLVHVWVVFVSKDGAFFLLGQTLIFLLPLTVIGSG